MWIVWIVDGDEYTSAQMMMVYVRLLGISNEITKNAHIVHFRDVMVLEGRCTFSRLVSHEFYILS